MFWWLPSLVSDFAVRVGGSVAFLLALLFYGNSVLASPFTAYSHLLGTLMLARQSAPVQTGNQHSRYERRSDMGSGYVSLNSVIHGFEYGIGSYCLVHGLQCCYTWHVS